MLEDPIMIGGESLEMPDIKRKVVLPEWLREALASDPHDTACRRPKIFPFSMPHWIKIDLAQEGFGQSREISQCLGVDLSRHHAACLDRRGIKCEGILDFNPFGQEICLELPLHNDLPLFRGSGRGNSDEYDREHQHEVGHPSLVFNVSLAANEHRTPGRLWKNYVITPELPWSACLGQEENTSQDTQKDRPARPQRAKRRGVRFGTLSL